MRCVNLKMGSHIVTQICNGCSRNCTEWHFLRVYDTGSKINPNISSGIFACMHHTIFCGNQMLRNVLQFRSKSASLYKNMTPRKYVIIGRGRH